MSTSGDEAWFFSFLLKEYMLKERIYMRATFPQCDMQE